MEKIVPIPTLTDNYTWVGVDASRQHAFVVDPGDAAPVRAWLEHNGLPLAAILVTHHHGDHTAGVRELADRFGPIPVYGPARESITGVDHAVSDGETAHLEGFGDFEVIDCPGHTAGHIAYLWDDHLFCGDALFAGGCGRIFEGNAEQMHSSLLRLAGAADDVRICCGHEYTVANLEFAARVEPENPEIAKRLQDAREARGQNRPTLPSTMAQERATNPFLRAHVDAVRRSAETWAQTSLGSETEVFAALRRWKDKGR